MGLFALMALLGLAGAGIGGLMTWHHDVQMFGDASMMGELAGCEASEEVNCDIVNTSEYSELFSIPIATWGIATYLLISGLAAAAAAGRREVEPVLLAIGAAISAYAVFLFGISKLQLEYVCLWCMRLYGINFAVLILSLVAQGWKAPRPDGRTLGLILGTFVLLTGLSIGGERAFRGSLLGEEATDTRLAQKEQGDAAQPAAEEGVFKDPDGPLEPREIKVKTEDGNDAILYVRADDAWKGNPDAEVVLVEFADLECGYCKRASAQLKRLYEAYGDEVLFVFKHFPLDPACNPGVKNRKHRDACRAAQGAVCAQQQGRFWAFHDLAFKNQHQLEVENLRAYAEAVEMDLPKFDACMQDRASGMAVVEDGKDGELVEAHGTPRVFIDGRLYRAGTSAEQMAVALERALGRSAADARKAARALAEERETIKPIPDDVPEMQRVTYGELDFLIDTFESSLSEGGAATVGRHQVPATQMSWFAARDACAAAGKRLCAEAEWVAACQSAAPVDDDGDQQFADDMVEGMTYPYSDYHNPTRCWDGHSRGTKCGPEKDQDCRPVYTGELPGCVTQDGVYDMTGNVEEWVGTSAEGAVLLGGAFDTSKDHARCYRRNDTYGPGFANIRTGFRCCKDPSSP